ncbi:dihydropyrimidinase [Lactonifactor longoviformis]|uniref:dihydropyrimidinase n=1 Tax=Lactonifactor longoviformis TaxID=341220 RepID=UPI001D003243|nr:dihydropyrimidinase [Lactonifactor longoviformis]MCB5711786.1 dihydropyrimidinase [Lactonifactor longoviformis]MCB5715753.1 dihydropyrimidinase [Lactonifactor longoviformis]
MKQLLKHGTVVSGVGCCKKDILIENGIIREVSPEICDGEAQVVDAKGKLIFPGFIDAHTHMDLPVAGTVTADDFYSGTRAAVAGGTTCIVDFATQYKGETLEEALENWNKKAEGRCSCDYGFHMAISDLEGAGETQVQAMIDAGVSTFKLYMTYPDMLLRDGELYRILKQLKKQGGIAGVHCENAEVIDALTAEAKAAGHLGPDTHPRVRPAGLEAEAVNRLLAIAKEADAPVIVVHLTCWEAFAKIQRARARGQIVFAETCPQYLLLDESCYKKNGFEAAKYVCSPPLRKKVDQECLWEALKTGDIQTVSTDHCSFTLAQKEMGKEDFTKIPNGMPGVETRGVLLYTYGVEEGRMTLEEMCRVLSENPAKLYGMYPKKGCLEPGSDADLVILDPHKPGIIQAKTQEYNMDYAPFEGWKLKGTIDKVYLRGNLVVDQGKVVSEKQGQYISRGKYQTDFN